MNTRLLAFLLVISCSCGRRSNIEKENTNSVLVIDLLSEPISKVTKLSDFAKDIKYIPLQTTDESLIGNNVERIVSIDNRIYIQNRDEILCFDLNGKYYYKLQNRGRGPEEYTFINDFDVSSDNKFLTILSSLIHKIMVYDISDKGFTFQRYIILKDPAPYRISMIPETDNAFLAIPPWRGTELTLSLLINTMGDTLHFKPNCYKYEMIRKENSWAMNEMLVYSVGKTVCFKEEFSDTVFFIDSKINSFMPKMIFNSHGTLGTPEMRGSPEPPGNNITFIANIFETARYVFYWYGTKETRNRNLFDKKTTIKYLLDTDRELKSGLKDDLVGGPDYNVEFIKNYSRGEKLFSFAEAIALKKYVDSEDFKNAIVNDSKKKDELKKLADSLNETDNPVLIIVTPKE